MTKSWYVEARLGIRIEADDLEDARGAAQVLLDKKIVGTEWGSLDNYHSAVETAEMFEDPTEDDMGEDPEEESDGDG